MGLDDSRSAGDEQKKECPPTFRCQVVTCVEANCTVEYGTVEASAAYETRYTARMEVDPATATLRYYLDGTLLGGHIPADAAVLIAADCLQVSVEARNDDTDTYGSRYVDDVRVTPQGR